jgi:hypothetical protein
MAAIRSLDRARRNRAATLLTESRERLNMIPALAPQPQSSDGAQTQQAAHTDPMTRPAPSRRGSTHHVQPPPIAEVLRDVYEEEKKTA